MKNLKNFLVGKKGEGVLTGILWMAVVAIVCGALAVAVWNTIGGTGSVAKSNINTSTNSAITNASSITP